MGPDDRDASVLLRRRSMLQLKRVWRTEARPRDASLRLLQRALSQLAIDPHQICPWGTTFVPAPVFERVCELLREQAIAYCMPGVERLWCCFAFCRHNHLQVCDSPFRTPCRMWLARSANVDVESGWSPCETCLWDRAKRIPIVHGPFDCHSQKDLVVMVDVRVVPYLQESYPVCFRASFEVGSSGVGRMKRCQPAPSIILPEP